MPVPESGPEVAAQLLTSLANTRVEATIIDAAVTGGVYEPHELIMTSMGNRRKAIITPFFPALQYDHSLSSRLQWSQVFNRPFVEAVVGYSRKSSLASLTVRYCAQLDLGFIAESAWSFPVDEELIQITTTEDVIGEIWGNADQGKPIARRSGLVGITEDRLEAGNWAISHHSDPDDEIQYLESQIAQLPFRLL